MAGKISLCLGKTPLAPTNGVSGIKRSHAALCEDDEEVEQGRAQEVSHFDKSAGGAVGEREKRDEGPLVIAPQQNRDWKEASRRRRGQRNHLPAEAHRSVSDEAIKELEASKPAYGLNLTKRESDSEVAMVNRHDVQAETQAVAEASGREVAPEANGEASVTGTTDDELALNALLGKTIKSELVLPAITEEEAFENDYRSAPDMASLDDYARVPVEQFGAALLRGMGWKEGQGIGSQKGKPVVKSKPIGRRPALLGIGAKEEAAVAQEMGIWGKAAKRGGEVKVYQPVLLRDKATGEVYTEEELQKKHEADERKEYERAFDKKERDGEKRRGPGDNEKRDKRRNGHRGERRHRSDDRHESRDRDRRRDEMRNGHREERRHVRNDRDKSLDRDGSRDRGQRDDRDRRRRDVYSNDEEYERRKEKERRRREHETEDSEHNRESSRRHDSDRERRRDRGRDQEHDRRR